jgi:hypothetical protein
MVRRLSAAELRMEISARNVVRGAEFEHELSWGAAASVIYQEAEAGGHGNFLPASYARIVARPEWRRRLRKSYTASRFVPRVGNRKRYELECANSSDALLMNVFCYPRVMSAGLCGLLGIDAGTPPEFGFAARVPLKNGRVDRTEIDMKLGGLLVEAKLTEGDFQRAPVRRPELYRDVSEVFDLTELPVRDGVVRSWQLIRGALAAHALGGSFALICDGRRMDLIEAWFGVVRAVKDCSLRTRLGIVTWQEIAAHVPRRVRDFLAEKYGIAG